MLSLNLEKILEKSNLNVWSKLNFVFRFIPSLSFKNPNKMLHVFPKQIFGIILKSTWISRPITIEFFMDICSFLLIGVILNTNNQNNIVIFGIFHEK